MVLKLLETILALILGITSGSGNVQIKLHEKSFDIAFTPRKSIVEEVIEEEVIELVEVVEPVKQKEDKKENKKEPVKEKVEIETPKVEEPKDEIPSIDVEPEVQPDVIPDVIPEVPVVPSVPEPPKQEEPEKPVVVQKSLNERIRDVINAKGGGAELSSLSVYLTNHAIRGNGKQINAGEDHLITRTILRSELFQYEAIQKVKELNKNGVNSDGKYRSELSYLNSKTSYNVYDTTLKSSCGTIAMNMTVKEIVKNNQKYYSIKYVFSDNFNLENADQNQLNKMYKYFGKLSQFMDKLNVFNAYKWTATVSLELPAE